MIASGTVVAALTGCGSDAAAPTDASDAGAGDASLPDASGSGDAGDAAVGDAGDAGPRDAGAGPIAFVNVKTNTELETGFILGTAGAAINQVGCQFDGGAVVVATGTTSWKCARPTSWKVGSKHVVVAGAWNGAALSSTATVTVYAAQNHDFNGDGYPDLAVGAPFGSSNAGTVSIFYGSASGISAAANRTLTGPKAASMFGFALVAADLRSTGYADLVVGLASFSTAAQDPGTIYVFDGGSAGLPLTASHSLVAPAFAQAASGYSLAAGDYNGDGYQDVVVGYGGYNTFFGAVSFYKGSNTGLVPDGTKIGTTGQELGNFVGLGDFFGTGYAAVAIGVSAGTQVFAGGASGVAATSSVTIGESGALNTAYIKRNDYADLVITGNAQAVVHYGSATGPSTSTTTTVADPPAHGWGTVVPGDIDLDGHDDIVFANPCRSTSCDTGEALVFLGGSTGVSATSSATIPNPAMTSEFGYALAMTDMNGDGRLDVAVATNATPLYAFYATGATPPFPSTPSLTVMNLIDAAFSPR